MKKDQIIKFFEKSQDQIANILQRFSISLKILEG